MNVEGLRKILGHLEVLYIAAGAKGPAKDLKSLCDVLAPHDHRTVGEFVDDAVIRINRPPEKSKGRKKTTTTPKRATLNEVAISAHADALRNAGTNPHAFDAAFQDLKIDKVLKLADVAEIARRYSESSANFRTIAAAHKSISQAFIRQARFENKLR